ncbi:MAG: hypothetical protein ABIF10_07030 [Candidatus Woesearchaeota archaeon]
MQRKSYTAPGRREFNILEKAVLKWENHYKIVGVGNYSAEYVRDKKGFLVRIDTMPGSRIERLIEKSTGEEVIPNSFTNCAEMNIGRVRYEVYGFSTGKPMKAEERLAWMLTPDIFS